MKKIIFRILFGHPATPPPAQVEIHGTSALCLPLTGTSMSQVWGPQAMQALKTCLPTLQS